ncbi:hypothetical protein [Methylophaga sp.]|uniref:hypothetical protein n=1 Tax=Methylophaga sp. TaxID=2024840 RepID=UPI003A8CC752
MALSAGTLKLLIVSECEAQGFVSTGEYARISQLAEAIANAVVKHITEAASVPVTSGSSAGAYKVT